MLWVGVAFTLISPSAFGEGNRPHKPVITKEMTLADCVFLAVRNNRGIESAYLDRVVQKYDLKVAEDEFVPDLTIGPSVQHSSTGDGDNRSYTNSRDISAQVTERIPTGGQFSFTWGDSVDRIIDGEPAQDTYGSSWSLSFQQPLLRGGGITVNTASLETARFNEQINVLSLKSIISETITSAILAYRNFLQAQEQLDISRRSLLMAKDLLDVNKALIDAGRMAKVEIVQSEADVANKEFSLTQAENAMDAARLSLLKVIDMDKHTMIVPTEKIVADPVHPDPKKCLQLALKNRRDSQQALLTLEISELNLILAKNNRLWDLSLEGAYGITGADTERYVDAFKKSQSSDRSQWNVGLKLTIPIGDLTRKQRILSAEIALKKEHIRLKELKENIEIEVQDAVREVEMKLRQVELARQARELSERKLEIEKEKLRAGRSSNFQLVTFQNDLVSSQNNELNVNIAYLNALTALDKTLETTLDTWQVEVKED